MTKLAAEAGTAGNTFPSQKKMGIVASFLAAACMLTSVGAWAVPEAKAGDSPAAPEQSATLKTAANNNFKNAEIGTNPHWTIRLSGSVDQAKAEQVNDRLRALNKEDPTREITMIINSSGGSATNAMAIYDTMQSISNDVRTVCEGNAMSMAAMLLAGGTPGKRQAYQSCEIMLHEISTNIGGRLSNIKTWGEDADRSNEKKIDVLHRHTGLSKEDLRAMMIVDIPTTSTKEAQAMGLIDSIIPSKPMESAAPRKLPDDFCNAPERQQLRVCPSPTKP